MSIYGWAWGHGRLVPAKPAAQMSMDEALRGLCPRTLGDVACCHDCAETCCYGRQVMALEAAGEAPVPKRLPEASVRKQHEMEHRKISAQRDKMTRAQLQAASKRKVERALALIAQGLSRDEAAQQVGFSSRQSLQKAYKTVMAREAKQHAVSV